MLSFAFLMTVINLSRVSLSAISERMAWKATGGDLISLSSSSGRIASAFAAKSSDLFPNLASEISLSDIVNTSLLNRSKMQSCPRYTHSFQDRLCQTTLALLFKSNTYVNCG